MGRPRDQSGRIFYLYITFKKILVRPIKEGAL